MSAEGIEAAEVRDYYDDFLDTRMVKYRVEGNRRIDRAAERISSYLQPGARVLEIGCGIGIVTERIAGQVSGGHVWACDISPRNIEFARRTVRSGNVTFFVADILRDFEHVTSQVAAPVDVIALIDVLEHLPIATHAELFLGLRRLLAQDGAIVLTYPSPQYQRYLRAHEPEELQIIDEVVELSSLIAAAAGAGLSLRLFSLEDVWRRNQYVHCVLQTADGVERLESVAPSGAHRVLRRVQRFIRRRQMASLMKRRPGG